MRGFFCALLRISAPMRLLSGWLKLPQNPLQKFFPAPGRTIAGIRPIPTA